MLTLSLVLRLILLRDISNIPIRKGKLNEKENIETNCID